MMLDELKVEFPTIDDYPRETFDASMPQGYRVGCAGAYLRSNAVTRRFFIRRIGQAVEMLPGNHFRRAADLGSGAGFYLPVLEKFCEQTYGVELNPVIYLSGRMLQEKGHGASLVQADVTKLPFVAQAYDLLFCLSVIEHIKNQKEALDEFARVLAPNGVLLLGYPLQNAAQHAFESGNKVLNRAGLFFKLGPRRALERLAEIRRFEHHHVDDFSQVSKLAAKRFELLEKRTVRLMGFTVYELLALKKLP
jgi:ubiquinone/menaquinone biosynthesis C-methylase UbiE